MTNIFRIEIISDRHDELDVEPTKTQKPTKFISSGLTDQRRLKIIEEILQKLKKSNVLNDVRQANRISYRLPEYILSKNPKEIPRLSSFRRNQTEKNIAQRMRLVMGTDVVMLNDPMFMKTLCQRLEENRRVRKTNHFLRSNRSCSFPFLFRIN